MPATLPDRPLGELVAETPRLAGLFEELGLDFCCGGKRTLAEACDRRSLDLDETLRRIEETAATPDESVDWRAASPSDLADHIEQTHHAMLRRDLPRLRTLMQRVADTHGARDPRLGVLVEVFDGFCADLEQHMRKEERVLFPAIRALEHGEPTPFDDAETLNMPLRCLMDEHDDAGEALARMRTLTDGFQPREGACASHRAMLSSLEALERDMHLHVHKENNILFPAARALLAGK